MLITPGFLLFVLVQFSCRKEVQSIDFCLWRERRIEKIT